jgi:digeranylgeranylglycerophospholipid reductase
MTTRFDVIVGGGSVGGLSFAADAAKRGLDVLVLEEDGEIGEPEKCDGLVSLRELRRYSAPAASCIQSDVRKGTVFSPSGKSVCLDASRLEVVVIDRSEYDKQLAEKALACGVTVKTGTRVLGASEADGEVKVNADQGYSCSYFVDATGPSGVIKHNRRGLIPAAKYELEGDWFNDGEVEVYVNQELYPGFFAWVIPRGDGMAKVGAAGYGISAFKALDAFLAGRRSKVIKKVAATIYVGGPIESFVSGRTIFVGESAGQVKPTTAGGILTSVAGGVIAARWVADSLHLKDPALIANYQKDWDARFGRESRLMRRLRTLFESLSNTDVEKIVGALSSERVSRKLASTDFDFHGSALLSALGVRGVLQLSSVLLSAEARQVLSSLA